ncbi:MAG: AAA family ATPase [Planctomycetes bacterium]|jgi:hypothetical protein|nr:AAA family ATPase [Planctomycetota bacterium]MBT4027919.1 AAA family ATPase [Planctomycetota bacterium]MBT4560034.1 AAA family ATPase [Planctomycetota bacterium]MBT5100456.1 AAA family ATPase [Planctomycetota bacterium]MBT5119190.1 AAA family ATPase [Planctomycetota bacterium]
MDPVLNPFSPGAGTPPPELAGRDALCEQVRVALLRAQAGLSAKSVLMLGLRGVGKTVLLDQMRNDAEAEGLQTIRIEAPEGQSLPAILAPQLRVALIRLSRVAAAKSLAERALRGLAGFVGAIKFKYQDVELVLDAEPELGLADYGDLEHDLQALFEVVGAAAKAADTALILFVDELQYVEEKQLAALITALHRMAQRRLPVVLVGAGLPQLRGQMGRAKSYAERLFDFPEIGPLADEFAKSAVLVPLKKCQVEMQAEAMQRVLDQTQGYPYFLQEWGKHIWDVADSSPIDLPDVEAAEALTIAALDEGFFRVRFDRLTPLEKRYLRAMAVLGPGPHRSGDVADELGRGVTSLAPLRSKLVKKGMIWSPNHGDTAFTVPLFDEFMFRAMPGDDWRGELG